MSEIIIANLSDISGFATNGTQLTVSTSVVNPGVYYINQSAPLTVTLPSPANLAVNDFFIIKDFGNAATWNITIVPQSALIDGASSKVITNSFGEFWLSWNGTGWSVLGSAETTTPASPTDVTPYLDFITPQQINPAAGPTAAAAINDAAIAAALGLAGHTGKPVYLSPGAWQISAPVSVGYFQTLFGGNRGTTKLIQNTNNTAVLQVTGPSIHVSDLTLTYTSPQGSGNTNSYGVEWNKSSSDFLYESTFERITVDSAAIGFGVTGGIGSPGNSEFQNSWTDCFARNCSNYGLILIGGSGSQWTNLRVEGSGGTPSSADCIGGIYIDNVDQTVFNTLNIEHIYPSSGRLLEMHNQCIVVANSLHFEGLNNPTDFAVTPIFVGFEASFVGVAVKLVFSTVNGHMRWAYAPASQNATIDMNAFEAYGNTVASGKKIAYAESDDNSNTIVLRDFGQRNQYADLIIPSRFGFQTIGAFQFAGPGGILYGGSSAATTPGTTMSAPFQDYAGTPTDWLAGDRVQSTNPSAGATVWVRTSGGAWITD